MYLKILRKFIPLLICLAPMTSLASEPLTFSSGARQVQMLELFTSQGCSSCPPAEKWLNKFKSDDRLWTSVIPINFHVDYWDYLGWNDPFARQQFTARQHQYRQKGNVRSVYTPGFLLNGKEWKGWFSRDPLPNTRLKGGVLSASLQGDQLSVVYSDKTKKLRLYVAVLGFDIETAIERGENKGRRLRHEFVVLGLQQHVGKGDWQVTLPVIDTQLAPRYGVAIWVSASDQLQPLQAVGGWVPEANLSQL